MIKIGYTLGDQAGIGPEIIASALRTITPTEGVEYCLIGEAINVELGRANLESAKAAWQHLELGATALKEGSIDALVTGPICKESLHELGFAFPGQTEFFADRLGVGDDYAMCLSGAHLTVALVTTHVALQEVPRLLTVEGIVRAGRLLADSLPQQRPRIALAGLNPHNGESGAFGNEEAELIVPALHRLQQLYPNVHFEGPCVPDVVYREAAAGRYDAIVAPYHDQALIPLKLLDFDTAVNMTLGLPRLRVSPDHGTAFSLAGKGIASDASMRRAFEVALQFCHKRH